ncbi:MAG TPA: hypothetical protein DDX98_01080 [Bacteroidales bacterium]|nr:hypothetical protein [Bacteroidales bacterium]
MAKEKDILKKLERLKDNAQFAVPENYFEKLPGSIMERIKSEEASKQVEIKRPVIKLIRNQLAIAASFAALALLAYTAIKIIAPDKQSDHLPLDDIYASLEQEVHELDEVFMYDLVNTESLNNANTPELSEQDIIEYLMEEGADLDLSLTDF